MAEAGRHLLKSCNPTPLFRQDQPEQVASWGFSISCRRKDSEHLGINPTVYLDTYFYVRYLVTLF